ncbi:MbcA/ParS/Xre antitoxin family protein [Neptunomonas qingdaonensis]|uniref:Antitoxin Xre/MbcA/ParS-like toxin-binding domain-containing protein n=1 Tax=Neptunomonas qingdaonensis TaxID=1045558 RepID=A0A1I2ME55_9GAMM|nr:MbcA/ParS/Xre antitoxin family protein [Neptunomonas qingdaonensis]SFF89732.1 Protein of unknown function [Neptunomonas qingdaonensis]
MTEEPFITKQILAEAVGYFGSEETALKWFRTPLLALGGESPGEYCATHYRGDKKIMELLNRLKHGLTA